MYDPRARLSELVGQLKRQGFRLTPQRMAVLKILASSKEHPSVERIYQQVQVDFPMTSLATIYKTVTLLKEIGEIGELCFSDGSTRYDGIALPHPHLICLRCRTIRDLEMDTLGELAETIAQRTGYQIERQRHDFFGICPPCQQIEAPK